MSETPQTDLFVETYAGAEPQRIVSAATDLLRILERENQKLRAAADNLAYIVKLSGTTECACNRVQTAIVADAALAAYQSLSQNAAETK